MLVLHIDLRLGQAVKIGNAPVEITGASGRGISEYNLDRGRVELSAICDANKKVVGEQLYNPGSLDQLERRYWNEDHVPERLGPQAPGWAALENGKETLLWP